MSPEEQSYYRERAAAERRCADQSSNPHVREIHQKLAELYERLVELDMRPPANVDLTGGAGAAV